MRGVGWQGWDSDVAGTWEPFGEKKVGKVGGGMLLGDEASLFLQGAAIFMCCWAQELFTSMMGNHRADFCFCQAGLPFPEVWGRVIALCLPRECSLHPKCKLGGIPIYLAISSSQS